MGNVTEVRDGDRSVPILTETEMDGWFGGRLLSDGPLLSHLADDEALRYVLHNGKRGLDVVEGQDSRTIAPDDGYRALAAVSDTRVRFVVGRADGDVERTVELSNVESVEARRGLLVDRLVVITAQTRYEFSCRGDVAEVSASLGELVRTWDRTYRRIDDARDHVDTARSAVDEPRRQAIRALERAERALADARREVAGLGDGALTAFEEDVDPVRVALRDTPRWLFAERARIVLGEAQEHRRKREYDAAYDRFEDVLELADLALEAPGTRPGDDAVESRRKLASDGLQALASAPLVDAMEAAATASVADDPVTAADHWETTIERYREALWIDRGHDGARFDGDRTELSKSLVAAVEEYLECRRSAAVTFHEAGRVHRSNRDVDAARAAYTAALSHLRRAITVVETVVPSRADELENLLEMVDRERDGLGPAEGDSPVDPGEQPDPRDTAGTDRHSDGTETGQ